jgi:surface protein
MILFPTVDEDYQYFVSQGYSGSINDMHYQALGVLGYTGSYTDRLYAYLVATYGSYHQALYDLRTGVSTFALGDRTYTTEFAMIVATTGAAETFTIPCQNVGAFNAVIDWGDNSDHSTITAYNDADLAHVYNSPGDHVIRITGTFPNIYFNNGGDKLKVKSVENFGEVGWTRSDESFYGCSNMTSFTSGTTDTSALLFMNNMFRGCTSLTSLDVSGFNTAIVTTMEGMFESCTSLTSLDVSSWNTSSLTNMFRMFFGCTGLTSIDVSSFSAAPLTNIGRTFQGCTGLTTLDVSSWDTSSVNYMLGTFYNCNSLTDLIGVDPWDITGLNGAGDLDIFMSFVTLPTARYDALLLAWEAQDPFDGMAPNFGSSTYTGGGAVAAARASLISRDGWTITDGGVA